MGARTVHLLAGLIATLAWCAPAGAFTPPELFVRPQLAGIEHTPAGDWVPLASTPDIDYIGGFQVGYRLQSSGEPNELQRAALSFVAVPDGQATQPQNTPPYCVTKIGTPGEIVPVGSEVQFEGDGTYTVKVSVGAGSGSGTDCLSGPATTGSFTVSVRVAAKLVGDPLSFRGKSLAGNPFVGVHVDPPPGGFVETGCARDATVQPDGSIAGANLHDGDFSESGFLRPGAWTCVARGFAEGLDENSETVRFGTPWSAPVRFVVHSDFRRARGVLARRRAARPRLTFTAEFPEAANGGAATLKVRRFVRCARHRFVSKKTGTYRGRFDSRGKFALKIRRPRKPGYYRGLLSFAGTALYRAGTDPVPVLFEVDDRGRFDWGDPMAFPSC